MMINTSTFRVPIALFAFGVFALCFQGCEKTTETKEADKTSPENYMRDEAFLGKLKAERARQGKLMQERNKVADEMKAMIEAKKKELKTEDLSKVQVELEKDPAWRALYVACTNANAKVEQHRKEMFGVVRERITPREPNNQKLSK